MPLYNPLTANGLTDVDQTTQGAGKVLTNTTSGGKAFSYQTPLSQTVATWTPTDLSGASLTLTVTTATYIKTGKLVYVQFDITYPATADTSTAQVSMPFLGNGNNQALAVGFNNSATSIGCLVVNANPQYVVFYRPLSASGATNVLLSGSRIVVSGTYQSAT